nr:transcriptional regulator [Xanthomonas fragariae]
MGVTTADQAALEIRADRQSSHRSTGKYDPSLALAFRISRLFGESIEHVFRYEDGQ